MILRIITIFLLLCLSVFTYTYLMQHTYYFNMLSNFKNYLTILITIIGVLIPLFYLIKKRPFKISGFFISFLIGFFITVLGIGAIYNYLQGLGYITVIINYLIIFLFYITIILSFFSIGNLITNFFKNKEVKQNEINYSNGIYLKFLLNFGIGFGIFLILYYLIIILGLSNVIISYIIFAGLLYIIYKQKIAIKNYGLSVNKNVENNLKLIKKENLLIKIAYILVFFLIIFYIYSLFNKTFIPYPTAWDANHVYIFIPLKLIEYGGYPWNIDFRPPLSFWFGLLTFVGNLGFWTWFSQDTWMIIFNTFGGFLALMAGLILVNLVVELLSNKGEITTTKKITIKLIGYMLVLAWLTSGMGMFLVAIDNKTDLAVLGFSSLGVISLLYHYYQLKKNKNLDK